MMRSWTRRNGSNPLGSLSLHPRCGKIRADVNRQIIQDSPYGRGRSAFEILVWFRLGRLRLVETYIKALHAQSASQTTGDAISRYNTDDLNEARQRNLDLVEQVARRLKAQPRLADDSQNEAGEPTS